MEKVLILQELDYIKNLFLDVMKIIPKFNITNKKVLPYGLKPHTRSVSWIIEQVITQQTKFHAKKLGLEDVNIDLPDTSLHDCIITNQENKKIFVNIKVSQINNNNKNKNDISAVEKLYMQYSSNIHYRLNFVVIKFSFDQFTITFHKDNIITFSPQFLPIYINPRNDKIQAYYNAKIEVRSRKAFLKELVKKSNSIILQPAK